MRLRNAWVSLLGIALAVNTLACGGSQETSSKSAEPSSPSATPAGQKVDTATAGDVKGVVTLDGVAPKNEPIKMNADPVWSQAELEPAVSGYLDVGSDGKATRQRVICTSRRARQLLYDTRLRLRRSISRTAGITPHVFGHRVGQPLEILNSDPTLPTSMHYRKATRNSIPGSRFQG